MGTRSTNTFVIFVVAAILLALFIAYGTMPLFRQRVTLVKDEVAENWNDPKALMQGLAQAWSGQVSGGSMHPPVGSASPGSGAIPGDTVLRWIREDCDTVREFDVVSTRASLPLLTIGVTARPTRAQAYEASADIFKHLFARDSRIGSIQVLTYSKGKGSVMSGQSGAKKGPGQALADITMSRETAKRINWATFDLMKLPTVASAAKVYIDR